MFIPLKMVLIGIDPYPFQLGKSPFFIEGFIHGEWCSLASRSSGKEFGATSDICFFSVEQAV
jgi:hypothetical protein